MTAGSVETEREPSGDPRRSEQREAPPLAPVSDRPFRLGPFIRAASSAVGIDLQEGKFRKIAAEYDICGYKRIYLVHIRKTAGTSLINMFFSLSGGDPASLYRQIASNADGRMMVNRIIYAGWNIHYINRGHYYLGFSHRPIHELRLPQETFTVSCFRDPVERVLSHYNMLVDFHRNKVRHPCMKTEGKWIEGTFNDFLSQIPRKHLLNQLYMFSKNYDVEEAVSQVKRLSHYFFSDNFDEGVKALNAKLGLGLEPAHVRKSSHREIPSGDGLERLRDMMALEYDFLSRIRPGSAESRTHTQG
jgi:hypothetical protein